MRHLRQVGAVLALLVVASSVASAQRTTRAAQSQSKVWELGFDAGLSFGLDDPNFTALEIPVSNFRAGIHATDVLSIEPFGSISYLKVEGVPDPFTQYTFGVGGLYHFSAARTRSQMYVRPFLALIGASVGGTSNSDIGVGVGFGMKWPKLNGRMALRGEANVASVNSATSINALFGFSFFTR